MGINLAKYVWYLYVENYKSVMKESKEKLNKLRYSTLMDKRLSIVKDSSSFQWNVQVQYNAKQNQIDYFATINKVIIKFKWRGKRFRMASSILKVNNEVGELTLLNFKTYYKATVIRILKHQWIRIEDPEINLHEYSQLIFDIGKKIITM